LVVCGEADTGRDAVAMAVELRPDVVVLDLSMPDLNGLEVMREIRRAVPAKVVVLSAYAPDQFRNEVLAAAGDEYVFKGDAGRTLVDAIHALLDR
jgi:DNA-binding NarL/FixJ family response regulator